MTELRSQHASNEKSDAQMFTESVVSAVDAVQHLYRETHRLTRSLIEAMAAGESFSPVARFPGIGKDNEDKRMIIRAHFTTLFRHGLFSSPEDEGEDFDVEEQSDESEDRMGPVKITSGERLLALRVQIRPIHNVLDPTPRIIACVVGDWRVGDAEISGSIELKSYMYKRLMRSFEPPAKPTANFRMVSKAKVVSPSIPGKKRTKSKGSVNYALLSDVFERPLFNISSHEAIAITAENIKALWKR